MNFMNNNSYATYNSFKNQYNIQLLANKKCFLVDSNKLTNIYLKCLNTTKLVIVAIKKLFSLYFPKIPLKNIF